MSEADTPAEPPRRPFALSMPSLNRRDLLVRAALESALIVVSVLLALFLDQWRADREIAERLATTRVYLVQEIRANRDALRADPVLPYHLRTQALVVAMVGPPGPERVVAEARYADGAFQGVHPFRAQDVVWSSFRDTELASRMPAEQLFALAAIYDAQADLERLSEGFLTALIQPSADSESEAYRQSQLRTVAMYFADVIPAEQGLSRRYDQVLAQLETTRRSSR